MCCARATVIFNLELLVSFLETGTGCNRTNKTNLTGITTICTILKLHPRNACFIICCISRGETTPHNSHPPSDHEYTPDRYTHTLAPLTPLRSKLNPNWVRKIVLICVSAVCCPVEVAWRWTGSGTSVGPYDA